jgi:hypothetical protein
MSLKKFLVAIAFTAFLGIVVISVVEIGRLHGRVVELQSQCEVLSRKIEEDKIEKVNSEGIEIEIATMLIRNVSTNLLVDARQHPNVAQERARAIGLQLAGLLNDPKILGLLHDLQANRMSERYALLFSKLKLDEVTLKKFENLLVQRQVNLTTAIIKTADPSPFKGGPASNMNYFRRRMEFAESENDSQIKTLIGQDNFAAYEQFERTAPQRNAAVLLQQVFEYTKNPLTNAQFYSLLQSLIQTSSPESPYGVGVPFGAGLWDSLPPIAFISDKCIELCRGFLVPSQISAMKQLRELQLRLYHRT